MADKRLVWAPQARADLLEIWGYFVRVGSADVADGILFDIERTAIRLRQHQFMGRSRDDLVPGLRSILAHPHVIFYRISGDTIEIARVLHQRRDLAAVFSREPDRGDGS
jgi:toxin ParE1/3/4